jgi:porphobilinogen synthase
MIRETQLSPNDLILPLFVTAGQDVKNPIPSMPGHFHLSVDHFLKTAQQAYDLGVPAVIIFGIPEKKDALGTEAYADNGIVQKATRALKKKLPDLVAITDVCLCQYTDHGHCGVVKGNIIDNDASLDLIARTALSHAEAGADMVAPSDMMDGRISEIREILMKTN